MKVEIKFNTIGGETKLLMEVSEALKSEVRDQVKWILSQVEHGVSGGTFVNVKNMGKVEINLVRG
jgi:copper(I)-binding protein